jgi:hypothetical protein
MGGLYVGYKSPVVRFQRPERIAHLAYQVARRPSETGSIPRHCLEGVTQIPQLQS